MKTSQIFRSGSLLASSLGAVLFCSAGLLRAQEETASNEWPRSYTVDDDDVVIYQPKVEKWDQKFLVARFAVGVKGKNDAQPIYGSFVARAETQANLETHMVSVYNVKTEDFKFPDAGDRIEHIKRDIAAVSPEKPMSLPMDDLVVSAPTEDTVGDDTVLAEGLDNPSKPAPAPAATEKTTTPQPVVMSMKKGVAPLIDTTEDDTPKGGDEEVPAVKHPREIKSTVKHDSAPSKEEHKRSTRKDCSASPNDHARQDNDKEAPKVTRRHESIAAPTHDCVPHVDEPKPRVVHHVRGADTHLVYFEKRVYLGEHGEVLRHGVKHRIIKLKREPQEERS